MQWLSLVQSALTLGIFASCPYSLLMCCVLFIVHDINVSIYRTAVCLLRSTNCISIHKLCASSGATCVVLAISFLQCTITTFIRRTNGKIWEPSNKAVLFRILGSNKQKSPPPRHNVSKCPVAMRHANAASTLCESKRTSGKSETKGYLVPRTLRAGQSGVRFPARGRGFNVLRKSQTGREDHPASCSMDTGDFFLPRVKRPGREVNHSRLSSTDVMNEWSCTSTPPIYLHGVYRFSIVNTRYSVRFEFLMATTVILT
jgi:hypothetical protein